MTQIDEQQVRHIAHLSRLDLSDAEISQYGRQLGDILAYVETLNEVETDGVEPTAHAMPISNVFRADETGESLGVDKALQNAPDKAPPYFKVPKVLDQQSA
ncbi:MAG TPA: Asp-tRNA(Asn)/Glu-tRNA(Gln) amidotransferase subunit GatC [Phycisphaerae bacterium]|nr:Asp-tRNA(Asn)/Glu-tRNA(Gln) amidotransferase subunit GatC [Phycisphaerae bacterium]HPF40320.1 Asp-tRNA(Asn)/Glu-tRNA(Gln) amidotransferase subunit GatC [Phycisphaerae bacterium]HRW54205.1 Asp-tRNA(Asn)/Glu-tRNA(Gln) amidotransferase subunit GatC [Phycisphaerae bacterium]HRW54207.1 Asp-tRNA(Asn)/Glu-tRNA(Gln) amidotransferase subunit GatC [Phycisphaerae bacterium]